MLKAENIYKSYGQLPVLKGVSIEIASGEVVTLVGSSGAGKSTLLQILGTLDVADKGYVFFDGKDITTLSEKQKAQFRNKTLGFVFQFHHLLPEFTALENVCMPGWILGNGQQDVVDKAKKWLERLGLAERTHHKPNQLSGGEQQRVAMARALINEPRLILADEPTGNLDTQNSEDLYKLIYDLSRTTGIGFLLATHNMALAKQSDRTFRIRDGVIVD